MPFTEAISKTLLPKLLSGEIHGEYILKFK